MALGGATKKKNALASSVQKCVCQRVTTKENNRKTTTSPPPCLGVSSQPLHYSSCPEGTIATPYTLQVEERNGEGGGGERKMQWRKAFAVKRRVGENVQSTGWDRTHVTTMCIVSFSQGIFTEPVRVKARTSEIHAWCAWKEESFKKMGVVRVWRRAQRKEL
jgi:hypothetical protein